MPVELLFLIAQTLHTHKLYMIKVTKNKSSAGSSRLETWFMDDQGNSRGAFYVHVERL